MKELSTRQALLMFFICTIASKLMALPAFIAQTAGSDSIWVFLFQFILEGVFFLIFLSIMKANPDLTFRQLMEQVFGKVFAKILFVLLAGYFLLKALIIAEESYVLLNETIYVLMDKLLYAFVLLSLVGYGCVLHLRSYGRLIEILIYIIAVALGLSILISFGDVDVSNLLPIMANGVTPILNGMAKYCFWFGDFMLFYFILGNVKMAKHTPVKIALGWVAGCVVCLIYAVLFYGVFGPTSSIHIEAISEIAEFTPRLTIETKFDWVTAFIYPLALYYVVILYSYFSHNSFDYVFQAKSKKQFWLAMLVIAIIIAVLLFTNFTYEPLKYFISSSWFQYVIIAVQYGIPLLLPIGYVILNRKKERTA